MPCMALPHVRQRFDGCINMKHWVLYMSGNTVGTVDCKFNHFPPTMSELKNMQDILKEKFHLSECLIIDWKELTEEIAHDQNRTYGNLHSGSACGDGG